MGLPNLKNLFTGGASKLIDSVKGVISEFHLSPEDKLKAETEITKLTNEHLEKMASIASAEYLAELEVEKTRLKDMDSARNREIQVTTSDKAPLINKIITPILAIAVLVLVFLFVYLIMFKGVKGVEKDILVFILGSLTGYVGMVLSYYFGSSSSSQKKQDVIEKMSRK